MSDEEAEKAWEARERFFAEAGYPEQTDYHRGISYIGFKAGWRARDAEVAALRERVAELEAVQAKVLEQVLMYRDQVLPSPWPKGAAARDLESEEAVAA